MRCGIKAQATRTSRLAFPRSLFCVYPPSDPNAITGNYVQLQIIHCSTLFSSVAADFSFSIHAVCFRLGSCSVHSEGFILRCFAKGKVEI
jgi:hypothetical protein